MDNIIGRLRTELDSFRWSDYQRDYRQRNKELTNVYWCVVAIDKVSSPSGNNSNFDHRLLRSLMVCFYMPNDIEQRLRIKFRDLRPIHLHKFKEEWENWRTDLHRKFTISYFMIEQAILNGLQYGGSKSISLDKFDNDHKMLRQKVSIELLYHLRGKSALYTLTDMNLNLGVTLPEQTIDVLTELGQDYLQSRLIYGFLTQLSDFKRG